MEKDGETASGNEVNAEKNGTIDENDKKKIGDKGGTNWLIGIDKLFTPTFEYLARPYLRLTRHEKKFSSRQDAKTAKVFLGVLCGFARAIIKNLTHL